MQFPHAFPMLPSDGGKTGAPAGEEQELRTLLPLEKSATPQPFSMIFAALDTTETQFALHAPELLPDDKDPAASQPMGTRTLARQDGENTSQPPHLAAAPAVAPDQAEHQDALDQTEGPRVSTQERELKPSRSESMVEGIIAPKLRAMTLGESAEQSDKQGSAFDLSIPPRKNDTVAATSLPRISIQSGGQAVPDTQRVRLPAARLTPPQPRDPSHHQSVDHGVLQHLAPSKHYENGKMPLEFIAKGQPTPPKHADQASTPLAATPTDHSHRPQPSESRPLPAQLIPPEPTLDRPTATVAKHIAIQPTDTEKTPPGMAKFTAKFAAEPTPQAPVARQEIPSYQVTQKTHEATQPHQAPIAGQPSVSSAQSAVVISQNEPTPRSQLNPAAVWFGQSIAPSPREVAPPQPPAAMPQLVQPATPTVPQNTLMFPPVPKSQSEHLPNDAELPQSPKQPAAPSPALPQDVKITHSPAGQGGSSFAQQSNINTQSALISNDMRFEQAASDALTFDDMATAPLSEQVRSANVAVPHAHGKAELPQHIPRQLAELINISGNKSVEVALSPEELGRVKLSITQAESGIVVNILAERPDTLDLLRRHIDQLNQELKLLGYQSSEFSFSQEGGNSAADTNPAPAVITSNNEDSVTDPVPPSSDAPDDLPSQTGLDIRI